MSILKTGLALGIIFIVFASPIIAGDLIIGSGSSVVANNASLDINCNNVTVENGGVLDLNSSLMFDTGTLDVQAGGSLVEVDSQIKYCSDKKTLYVIPALGGKTVIICL